MKLYDELIDWYRIIDPHEDHAAEAELIERPLDDAGNTDRVFLAIK